MLTVPVRPPPGKIATISDVMGPERADGEGAPCAPISKKPEPPQSHFLLRDDGTVFVSLEDAADRALEGREVICCVALLPDEVKQAQAAAADGFAEGVAEVLGRLPRKEP
jgi:hypothetical protein